MSLPWYVARRPRSYPRGAGTASCTIRTILVLLLLLAGGGVAAGFQMTLLVVPSYRIVEAAHDLHVTYVDATGVYTLRYAAHNVIRIWSSASGRPDEIERSIAERTEEFIDLSPFEVGVHTIPSKLLESQPARYESFVVGDSETLPADALPPVDPTGPGLAEAERQDEIVTAIPPTLVSYEYLVLRGAEDDAAAEVLAAAAGVDESTNVGNEEASGDPVLVASGMFTTGEIDLALSAGAVSIVAERVHRSDLGLSGSLGSAWWFSLDTRIVLGESRRSVDVQAVADANAVSILTADVASLAAAYAASRAVITGPMGVAQAQLRKARETYDALAFSKLTYHGAYRSIVIGEINRQLLIAGRLVAAGEVLVGQFGAHLSGLDSAYGTPATGALGSLHDAAAEHRAVADLYRMHAARANSHAARNNRFVPGAPRSAGPPTGEGSVALDARMAGNDSVTLIDTDGVPRRFSYVSVADIAGGRTYADGFANYFPSGTDLRPEKPTEDTLRLTPGGEFILTRKDGTRWIYGVCGQLMRIEDRNGNRAAFYYDSDEQLNRITDSRGREIRLERDASGLLVDIHAPEATHIHYAYDADGRLAAVIDPAGDTVRFEYEGTRIIRITKPDESFREYRYEYVRGALRATATADEEGKIERFDFTFPDRTVYTNPSGVQTVHHYNDDRRASRIDYEGGAEHPGGLSELFAYNSAGDRTYRRATDGSVYRYTYDGRHNLLRIDYPDGSAESWTYNSFNLPATSVDRRDQFTDYRYDGLGNLTRVGHPDGTADIFTHEPPGSPAAGEVTTHTDRRGNVRTYAYDGIGFLRSISDTLGPVARYDHDALGRVIAYEDGLGNRTTYTYTLDGRLETVAGPEGFFIHYEYDERKDLVRRVENGRTTTFLYDDRHLLTVATNLLGETMTSDYRDDGKVTRRTVRSADGSRESTIEFQYDERGLLRRETQTEIGAVTEYEHDAAGRVAAVTDAEGSRTEFRYSFDGRLVGRIRYHDGSPMEATFNYYPGGIMRQAVDPLGRSTRWEHHPALRTLTRIDPLWNRWPTIVDPYGLVLTETDPTGRSTFSTYDARGRLITVRNDLNIVAAYGYDLADRLVTFTDGEGNTWRYEYDGRSRLLTVTHPDGAGRQIRYNVDDTIASRTDETGLVTFYEYDPLGRMIARMEPGASNAGSGSAPGRRTEYTWNYLGVLQSVTDPTSRTTSYRVDPSGRLTGMRDNTGALTVYERDLVGTVTAIIDPTGRRIDYEYDDLHRLARVLKAGRQTARYEYDDAGNLRYEYDGADEPHEFIYDDLDRLRTEINRLAASKRYAYDDAGRVDTITDYTGVTAVFSYDGAGLLAGISYSDATFLGYQYDRAGRMIATENQHERLEFTYTPRGRLATMRDGGVGSGANLHYDYDVAGRRTALEDLTTGRRLVYLHDDRGFLTGLDDSVAGFTSLNYDAAGRQTEIAAPNGVVTSIAHDAAGRVSATLVTNRSRAEPVIDALAHVYDEAGRRLFDVDNRGAITGYEYDAQGKLSQVQYPFTSPKRLTDYRSFEAFGVVAPVPPGQILGNEFNPGPADAQPGGTPYQSYLSLRPGAADFIEEAYRSIHPLQKGGVSINQQVWTEAFDYDASGNRTAWRTGWGEARYTYDVAGRLERVAGAVYDYDVAGNLTSTTTTAGTTHYTYTARNRLAVAATPEATVVYTYDPLGRRSSRRSSAPFQGPAADLTKGPANATRQTIYRYDGRTFAVISREEVGYLGGGDLSSLVKSPASDGGRYRPAPGSTSLPGMSAFSRSVYQEVAVPPTARDPAARALSISGPSGTTYLSHDLLGSVRVSTDAFGVAEVFHQYDAFGITLAGDLDPDQLHAGQPYGYNGKLRDPATGLSNYGFRDYLPAIARFTTPDPIKDGTNWYTYLDNDPVNQVDPWGLAPRNLTNIQRTAYRDHVAGFAESDATLPTYDSGPREGQDWDCADLAVFIASGAMDSATTGSDFYKSLTANGSPLASIPSIHSSDFAEDGNVTFYRNADGSIDNAFDSANVEAGTIGVFSNHVITVTADRGSTSDAIRTIQGHTRRDATWPDIISQAVLDQYRGEFIGWGEIGPGSTGITPLSQSPDSGIKNR